jgi:hypothetical protein
MTLESSFHDLLQSAHALRSASDRLRLAYDDKPPDAQRRRVEPYPVQRLGDLLDDLQSLGDEASLLAHEGCLAASDGGGMDLARRALGRLQECIQKIDERFSVEVIGYDRLIELGTCTRERRGEWPGWFAGLRSGFEAYRLGLRQIVASVLTCWQEVADHAGRNQVSVRTTTVGQFYAVSDREAADSSDDATYRPL